MTLPCERRRAGGFTLIEILVVLAILGLALGLLLSRGPARLPGLDLRATAAEMADTLRLVRAHAIAGNRTLSVVIDTQTRRIEFPDGSVRGFPPDLGLTLHSLTGPIDGSRLAIGFAPDGSSSGGAIELSAGPRHLRVGTAWLTGRVSVTDVP